MSLRSVVIVAAVLGIGLSSFAPDAAACGECKRVKKAVSTAAKQTSTNLSNAAEKAKTETSNLVENTEEAVRESGRFVRRQADVIEAAVESAGDGDLLTAGYRLQRDYINRSIDNSVQTLQASSMLRTGTQIALAAAPGGQVLLPVFTTTYVYKSTGNLDVALKAGAVTAATSAAMGHLSSGVPESASEVATRSLMSGHVAGTGSALMGGRYEEGFLLGASMSAANSLHQMVTWEAPDASPAQGWPLQKDGSDVRMMDYSRPHTGMANPNPPPQSWNDLNWTDLHTEHSPYLQGLARVPGVTPASVFHDIWTADLAVSTPIVVASIPPSFVVTYVGLGAPLYDRSLELAMDEAQKEE